MCYTEEGLIGLRRRSLLVVYNIAEDLPDVVLLHAGPEQTHFGFCASFVPHFEDRLSVHRVARIACHFPGKSDRHQRVAVTTMPGEGLVERRLAFLAQITPYVGERQIALRTRGRELRPDVLAEFLLVQRERTQD